MASYLPDPPDSLRGDARLFYDELRQMLADLDPSELDPELSRATFEDEAVHVELNHRRHEDWTLWADVGTGWAIVQSVFYAHEHFGDATAWLGQDDSPWPSQAVAFVSRILRGRLVIEATLRGDEVLTVRRFLEDDDGRPLGSGWTRFFPRERLFVWRPKRIEVVRPFYV